MLTLEEARTIQAKRQKNAIIKFFVYLGLIVIVFVCITLLTDYLASYPVLYVLFAGAIMIAVIRSKILKFLQKKEFLGVVVQSNINISTVKTNLSHQAGQRARTVDVPVLDIILESNDKKTLHITGPYSWKWGEYKIGDELVKLRFIDQPILVNKQ